MSTVVAFPANNQLQEYPRPVVAGSGACLREQVFMIFYVLLGTVLVAKIIDDFSGILLESASNRVDEALHQAEHVSESFRSNCWETVPCLLAEENPSFIPYQNQLWLRSWQRLARNITSVLQGVIVCCLLH